MKLKKIVSLALAGVMAVSMLAGCKSTGAANGGASSEAPVATSLTQKIIAALDVDNVTFTTDDTLQATLDIVVAQKNKSGVTSIAGSDLTAANKGLGDTNKITAITTPALDAGTDDQKVTYVFTKAVKTTGIDEEFIANQLAAAIEAEEVSTESTDDTMAGLPEKSAPNADGNWATFQYAYKYTASVATAKTVDTNGQISYIVAVALTRTPNKVDA